MNFNVNKCKRLHIRPTNPHNNYTIACIDLVESDQERDLGIIVDNKLKFNTQTAHIVNKGFSILGIITSVQSVHFPAKVVRVNEWKRRL